MNIIGLQYKHPKHLMMKIKAKRFFNLFIDISVNQLPFSRLLKSKVKPRKQNKILKVI